MAGKLKIWKYKLYRLATVILIEVYQTGEYKWQHHSTDPNDHLSAEHKRNYAAFQDYLAQKGKSNGTCELYSTISRQFLIYVQDELKMAVSNLQLANIHTAIVSMGRRYQKTSMRTVLSALRIFLSFLWLTGETRINLTAAVPSSGVRKVAVVPTLTLEEEVQLLNSIDRSTSLGKRNYAMVLLAIRTGLRSVDIVNLKLADINWRTNTISIIQQKNCRPLSLPLLPEVGNALTDYILQARPKSDEPHLFLKIFPPFTKLTSCYNISRRIVDKLAIRQCRSQYKGFHLFRHSVASRMLKSEVNLSVISNVLGHGSPESSKVYLSTDGTQLKACALTL
jgi:integrase